MYCWFCHHGWHPDVRKVYNEAADKLDALPGVDAETELHYGRAHIVWDDENFERHSIQWCIDHEVTPEKRGPADDIVVWSLQQLLLLPDDVLMPPQATAYAEACKTQESLPSLLDMFPPPWAKVAP